MARLQFLAALLVTSKSFDSSELSVALIENIFANILNIARVGLFEQDQMNTRSF